jgi:hypothetical protein
MTLQLRTVARHGRRRGGALAGWLSALCLATLLTAIPACNVIDALVGRHAELSEMVPGGNINTGDLECWLTLEFKRYPEGVDLRDVRVRFESIALQEPQEFEWPFIAKHDQLPRGTKFGSGYSKNDRTTPGENPPLDDPFKVRFPLRAKTRIENAPSNIWLNAELYWGGKKQDSVRRSIEHVYSRTENGFF